MEVGLSPANVAERFSRDKLVEEWLDLVVDRGYLTLGDLRDGLARNQLKLPDLAGAVDLLHGRPPDSPQSRSGRSTRRHLPSRRDLPALAATA